MKPTEMLKLLSAISFGLLIFSTVWGNEILYKWREADGTLTYSPNPPAHDSGISYERVSTGQSVAQGTKTVTATGLASKNTAGVAEQFVQSPTQDATINTRAESRASVNNARPRPGTETKTAQCKELRKRVISLERLLKTEITDKTMDNAVVQMARYQGSINSFCNRLSMN